MIKINNKSISFNKEFYPVKRGWKKINESELPNYFYDNVILSEDITFERIFNLIIKHKEILNIILGWGVLRNHKIEMFVDEFNLPYTGDDTDIKYLELNWICDYDTWVDENEPPEVHIYPSIHGIGNAPENTPYSIGFSPLNELKNIKTKINNEVSWHGYNINGKTYEEIYPLLLKGVKSFKLIDVFAGILYEISFYGGPKNRKTFEESLNNIDLSEKK